jgi:nitrate/nitrite transporter NarK
VKPGRAGLAAAAAKPGRPGLAAAAAKPRRAGLALGPLIGGCAVGLTISWNIANTGAVATLLSARYGTTLAVIGLLTTVLFLAEIGVMIPGGRAIDRFGAKRVGIAAVLLSLAGNLLLLTTTAPVAALLLRGLTGLGVGLGFLAGAIYAQTGAVGGAAALAGGIYGGVSLSGGGLALAIVPALVGPLGWRAPYWSGAAVAALALPVLAVCPATPGHGADRHAPSVRALLSDRRLARLGLFASVSFGFSVILGNWVVTLLERTSGYSKGAAGAVGSLILILGIVGRPAGGILVRALPAAIWRMVAASFAVGALGTALLALSVGSVGNVCGAALAGLAAGIPFGVTVSGASRAYSRAAGAAVGAMNVYPVLTIIVGAPLLGLTFSLPGDGRIGFALLAGLWACAIAAIPWGKRWGSPAVLPPDPGGSGGGA